MCVVETLTHFNAQELETTRVKKKDLIYVASYMLYLI